MVNGFTAIVHGQVQGVGFRFFVRNHAINLNLTGWVRNLPEGSVETQAFGPIPDLERLLHYINTGSVGSRVEQVDIQWFQTENVLKTFEIRG
jgi:acylphosphatase